MSDWSDLRSDRSAQPVAPTIAPTIASCKHAIKHCESRRNSDCWKKCSWRLTRDLSVHLADLRVPWSRAGDENDTILLVVLHSVGCPYSLNSAIRSPQETELGYCLGFLLKIFTTNSCMPAKSSTLKHIVECMCNTQNNVFYTAVCAIGMADRHSDVITTGILALGALGQKGRNIGWPRRGIANT